MLKKWKRSGAALLIAGLTVSGTSYVLANAEEVIDLGKLTDDKETPTTSETTPATETPEKTEEAEGTDKEESKPEADKEETDKEELPAIPEGYTAGNLEALAKAYAKVENPNAKAAIKSNYERALEKWEAKQQEETPEQTPVEKPSVDAPAEPVVNETPDVEKTKENADKTVNVQAQVNAELKLERKALKVKQKEEFHAQKEEQKAEFKTLKVEQKAEREALKDEQKKVRAELKAERKEEKAEKQNSKKENQK